MPEPTFWNGEPCHARTVLDWRLNHEELGHRWMGGYVNGVLVTVRCERCDKEPIEVLCTDFTSAPCVGLILRGEDAPETP